MKPIKLLHIGASMVSIATGVIFLGDRFGLWDIFNNPTQAGFAVLTLIIIADIYYDAKRPKYF